MSNHKIVLGRDGWIEIRDSRLWCKINPERELVEIVHRGQQKIIDLRKYGLVFSPQIFPQQEPAVTSE